MSLSTLPMKEEGQQFEPEELRLSEKDDVTIRTGREASTEGAGADDAADDAAAGSNEDDVTVRPHAGGSPTTSSDAGSPTASGNSPSAMRIGELVDGKYKVVDSLGRGGMGVVYKVEQILLQRPMALKTLPDTEFSEQSIRRFQTEAKLLSRLDHPGVVKVRDFGVIDQSKPFLVMDFVHGRTLASVLQSQGVMSLDAALKMFIELSFALGYAHSKGVVHRDVKPGNIMLTTPGIDSENEHVRILDFGIAKLLHSDTQAQSLTKTGEIFGSPMYMSPEQCTGAPIDHRSDIYSMGCVLYEALTGAPPFKGETSVATIAMHLSSKPLSLKEASLGRDYPPEVERVVARLLEKDPGKRYQSLLDVAQELIALQRGLTSAESSQSDKKTSASAKTASRDNLIWGSIALVTVALAVMFIWTYKAFVTDQPKVMAPDQLALDRKEKFTRVSADGASIIFTFPKDRSLGVLYYQTGTSHNVFDAKGELKFPSGLPLVFAPNGQFLTHPQYFRMFRPDDLYGLDFHRSLKFRTDFDRSEFVYRLSDDELLFCDHLSGLRYVQLQDNKITDKGLSHISELPNIKNLDVDRADVTAAGLIKMKCFPMLQSLRAGDIKDASGLLPALMGNQNLRELSLSNLRLTDSDLEKVSTVSNLQYLNLSWNKNITDDGLKHLTKLRYLKKLNLAQCSITPASLTYFRQMRLTQVPELTNADWPQPAIDELKMLCSGRKKQ